MSGSGQPDKAGHALQMQADCRTENVNTFETSPREGQDNSVTDQDGRGQEHHTEKVSGLLKVRLSAVSFSHGRRDVVNKGCSDNGIGDVARDERQQSKDRNQDEADRREEIRRDGDQPVASAFDADVAAALPRGLKIGHAVQRQDGE